MTPDAAEFVPFEDFYGPSEFGEQGNYTHFLQGNYANTDPSELKQHGIQITGYGTFYELRTLYHLSMQATWSF